MDRLVIDLMDFSVSLVSSLVVILYTNYTQKSTPDGDYNYILQMRDHFTKMTWLRPLKDKTAEGVAEALEPWLDDNGDPRKM